MFSHVNAWVGIAGFSFLTLFTFIATFVRAWYMVEFYVFGGGGGVLALTWHQGGIAAAGASDQQQLMAKVAHVQR